MSRKRQIYSTTDKGITTIDMIYDQINEKIRYFYIDRRDLTRFISMTKFFFFEWPPHLAFVITIVNSAKKNSEKQQQN